MLDSTFSAAPVAEKLIREGAPDIAYIHLAAPAASMPHIVFLSGYRSDMRGSKAEALHAFCAQNGCGFTRFDYRGHGESGGDFLQATLSDWIADAHAIINHTVEADRRVILIGSSMGGHIMLHLALNMPERIAGLIGIAAAPDFTERLMWDRASDTQKQQWQRDGVVYLPSNYSDEPYAITYKLIEDGRQHLLLDAPISIHCPVHLLHGMADDNVPYEFSIRLAEQMMSDNVYVELIKDGDHRLSRPQDLTRLVQAVDRLTNR